MDKTPAEAYTDTEKDSIKEYAKRMRKAKYQAFWIRVRFWIDDYEILLLLISLLIILGIGWYAIEIL